MKMQEHAEQKQQDQQLQRSRKEDYSCSYSHRVHGVFWTVASLHMHAQKLEIKKQKQNK